MDLESVIDYFEKTVKPTVDEYLFNTADIRRGRIAAIILLHVWDYAKDQGMDNPLKTLSGKDEMFYQTVRATANASKHFQVDTTKKKREFPHIAMKADQIVAEANEGLHCAPFGEGVFAESNDVYLLLDSPQTHGGIRYEYVNLPMAVHFVMAFWQQQIDNKLKLLHAR